MKKYLNLFLKVIGLTVLIIFCDALLNYFFNIIVSYISTGADAYVFHFNPIGFIGATFLRFFLIAGWAYLLAIIIYHSYRTTNFLSSKKFLWMILLFFGFYLLVDVEARYTHFTLTSIIFFITITAIYMIDKWYKNTSVLFIIFMMFFYYYWFEDDFDYETLAIHTLAYIPLAIIGKKLYERFFPE